MLFGVCTYALSNVLDLAACRPSGFRLYMTCHRQVGYSRVITKVPKLMASPCHMLLECVFCMPPPVPFSTGRFICSNVRWVHQYQESHALLQCFLLHVERKEVMACAASKSILPRIACKHLTCCTQGQRVSVTSNAWPRPLIKNDLRSLVCVHQGI